MTCLNPTEAKTMYASHQNNHDCDVHHTVMDASPDQENPDKCPICGGTLKNCGDEDNGYGYLKIYWDCPDCGTSGTAVYDESDSYRFLGHEVD